MPYNRMFAGNYAASFYDKVCHDGRVATSHGYPTAINGVTLTPALPFSQIGAINGDDDCTHFISCCVGQGRAKLTVGGRAVELAAGGLDIASPLRQFGVYGETYAPRLVGALIIKGARVVAPQFMPTNYATTRTAIQQNLGLGDILAFASSDHLNSDGTGHYEHLGFLLSSDGRIACHTRTRFNVDYSDIYFPWVTLLKLP